MLKKADRPRDIGFIQAALAKAEKRYARKIRKPVFEKNGYDRHMRHSAEQGFTEGWINGALYMYEKAFKEEATLPKS